MSRSLFLLCVLLFPAPARAWVPQLEATTAKNVIDGVYGRRPPPPTSLTIDLTVPPTPTTGGDTRESGDAASVPGSADACPSAGRAAPPEGQGSRPIRVTVSGQADQLAYQAQLARDTFRNLGVPEALGEPLRGGRLADGLLRVDVLVRGLPSEQARGTFLAWLQGPDGRRLAPARVAHVNDFRQVSGTWSGTLVYYFEPLRAGIGAGDRVPLLLRAGAGCTSRVLLDLGSFQ